MSETLEIRPKEFKMVDGHAVKEPEDYQDPELLYQSLIKRIREYHPSADISMIEKAYRIAKQAHEGQKRKSGEPYIIHPFWQSLRWIKRRSLQEFCMMLWKIRS